jgi:hypothetical protein
MKNARDLETSFFCQLSESTAYDQIVAAAVVRSKRNTKLSWDRVADEWAMVAEEVLDEVKKRVRV